MSGEFADGPGPWLRLTALAGAVATALVVAVAALHLDLAHRVLAAAALPPLVAVAAASVVAHPRLRPAALTGSRAVPGRDRRRRGGVSGRPAVVGRRPARRGCRGGARRRARVGRGDVPRALGRAGGLARLRHAHQAAHHVAAPPDGRVRDGRRRGRLPVAGPVRGDHGRTGARVRRGERAQPPARSRHRPDDGAHRPPPGGQRARLAPAGARVRPVAVGGVVRAARRDRERGGGPAGAGRQPVLRVRLHPLAEAQHAPEHRHRRSGRGGAPARRLGGCDREHHAPGAGPVPDRVRVDAAALLGACDPDQARVPGRRRADAARCAGRPGGHPPDPALLVA